MFQHGQSGGNRLVRYGFLLGEIAIEYISEKKRFGLRSGKVIGLGTGMSQTDKNLPTTGAI